MSYSENISLLQGISADHNVVYKSLKKEIKAVANFIEHLGYFPAGLYTYSFTEQND